METLPYVMLAVGVSFLAIVIAVRFILLHHEARNKVTFLLLLGSVIWLLMAALEVASDSLPTKLVFFKLQFVGVVIVPTTWLILTMQLSGYERWIKRSNLAALSAVPVITLLLIFTNPHGLMWSNLALNPVGPFLPLFESRGLGYWLLIVGYSYVVIMFGFGIFVRRVVASRSLYRRQAVPLIFASCIPWAFGVVWFLNPSLFMYIDPDPLALTVATSIILWRLAYLPGADVAPVAHELIVDSMNQAVIILDAQTRIVELNPRAEQLVGHNLSDAMGKPVEGIWAEWAEVMKELDSATESVREVSFGVGEEKKVYEMQSSHLSGIASERPNLLIILRDITERKRMEDSLRESERRFRELTDMLPETVFELGPNGNLTFLNKTELKMIGYDEADLKRGLSAFQVIAPEDHDALRGNIRRILTGGSSPGYEYAILRKDGSRFPGIAYATPIIKEGKGVGLRGVVVDITERKRMEERLLKAEHLAAIGETASMVAHDLRNPLQGITTAAYLLRRESLTADEKNEMLQLINSNVRYAEATVRDLLDYSREIHLERADMPPKALSQSALQAVTVPGNVKVQDMSQEQPTVSVDPDRMKRVLINLVENAVDAMPNGGTITIHTKESNGHVEITVSDTGTGMPEKIMENLWKPLQTTKRKGMGLGLPIVKRIVDAHGGEISVKTKSGEGTTFRIRLPLKITNITQTAQTE